MMTSLRRASLRSASLGAKTAARLLRRFSRARSGIAAVEFAFIMPIMLLLYFGIAVLGQGLEVGRKVQQASRTLADLTAQQLPATNLSGTCASVTSKPCLRDADLRDFYAGAELVMTPFDTSSMSATISLVIFDNLTTSTTSGCCRARVVWSAGFGANPTLRACGPLTPSANGSNGAALMPKSNYPGVVADGNGDPSAGGTYSVSPGTANTTDAYLIVADVSYNYKPGVDFRLFSWNTTNGGAGYPISQTTYMSPRFSATLPVQWQPDTTTITRYTNCPCVLSSGASCTVGTAKPSGASGQYIKDNSL